MYGHLWSHLTARHHRRPNVENMATKAISIERDRQSGGRMKTERMRTSWKNEHLPLDGKKKKSLLETKRFELGRGWLSLDLYLLIFEEGTICDSE
jgi:hypothetical protein